MTTPCEYTLAEKPTIDGLVGLGYEYLHPDHHDEHRDGENHVILRPVLKPKCSTQPPAVGGRGLHG